MRVKTSEPWYMRPFRYCSKCRETKPNIEFYDRAYICKPCRQARAKTPEEQDKNKARCKAYYRAHLVEATVKRKEYERTHRKELNAYSLRRYHEGYQRDKRYCRWRLNDAVHRGLIIRPTTCEACGKVGKIDGHHSSYAPEDWNKVMWLCITCHRSKVHSGLTLEGRGT